jgi:hypothetical protein
MLSRLNSSPISNHLSRRPSLGLSRTASPSWQMDPYSGRPAAFEALLSVSCANPKRPNSGCCAFCEFFVANPEHPVDGSLADDMEAVRPHNIPALLRSSRAISAREPTPARRRPAFCQILNSRPDFLRRRAVLLSKSPFQGIAQETQAELEFVLSQATNE